MSSIFIHSEKAARIRKSLDLKDYTGHEFPLTQRSVCPNPVHKRSQLKKKGNSPVGIKQILIDNVEFFHKEIAENP